MHKNVSRQKLLASSHSGLTCSITSGAIQHGVPTNVWRTLSRDKSLPVASHAETPKSAIITVPSSPSKMFPALISLHQYITSNMRSHISITVTTAVLLNMLYTSNVTGCHRGQKQKPRAGYRAPSLQRTGWLLSAITKTDIMSQLPSLQRMSYVAMRFHCRVWHRALSLRCACIRCLGIILIP